MQKNKCGSDCEHVLNVTSELEDLAEKKTKIYSRLLTDAELAQEMEALSNRHKIRKQTLLGMLGGKMPKKQKQEGRDETNGEEEEE